MGMQARWAVGLLVGLVVGFVLAFGFGALTDDDDEDVVSCDSLDASALGALIVVNAPSAAESVGETFTLSGCAATFEQNVQYRVTDREGDVLAAGFTTANAPDIGVTGEFSTEVSLDAPSPGIITLEVFEDDVSDGEGGVPPRHVIPLVSN